MGVDHSKSLLRITFHGLFVISKKGSRQWEVGVPNLGDHTFNFDFLRITGSPFPVNETPDIPSGVDVTHVFLRSDASPTLKTCFFDSANFDREDDSGDVNDYRWIMDMEGPEFHDGKKLKLRPNPPGVGFKSRIFIEGGMLYADAKTVERYKRFKVSNPSNSIELGKLGLIAGINLPRVTAGSRSISLQFLQNDGNETNLSRTQEQGVRYELRFTHTPTDQSTSTLNSHFSHYYDVLMDDDGDTRFDAVERSQSTQTPVAQMQHTHEPEPESPPARTHDHTASPQGGSEDPTGGNEPQVCNAVFLGNSDGLPL